MKVDEQCEEGTISQTVCEKLPFYLGFFYLFFCALFVSCVLRWYKYKRGGASP